MRSPSTTILEILPFLPSSYYAILIAPYRAVRTLLFRVTALGRPRSLIFDELSAKSILHRHHLTPISAAFNYLSCPLRFYQQLLQSLVVRLFRLHLRSRDN